MIRKKYIFFYFLLTGLNGFSQTGHSPFRAWQLTSLSGQAYIKGNYRESEISINDLTSKQTETYLNGIFQVRSQSFFVHPNFVLVNFNGIYNPETRRSQFIGIPENSEKNNREGLDLSAIFFKKKNYNLTTSASTYNSIQNIDNLTRIEDKSKYTGATFSFYNKILPFTLGYSGLSSTQRTLDIDRSFNLNQRIFQMTANKSFTTFSNHSFSYLHTENTSLQRDVVYISPISAANKIDFAELTDNFSFGKKRNYSFTSSIANSDEHGSTNYKTFSMMEMASVRLPKRFILSGEYNYRLTKLESEKINYNRIQGTLTHQLYESLNSKLLFEHWVTDQTNYKEQRDKAGIDLRYLKKISGGRLILTYAFYKESQSVKTSAKVKFVREAYVLTDNLVTLLKNQYVDMLSVVVKDSTGNTIYRPSFDYILIDRNPYVEIERVPGGHIPNNATVYIDYMAARPGLFEYHVNNHALNADVWLLKNKLNTYYRLYTQDYSNQVISENQALNIFSRHVIGTRLDFNFISGGAEFEYCKSNILPYAGMKYFVAVQKVYEDLYVTFNGNLSDFQMNNESSRRKDIDARCNIAYSILKNLRMNIDYMYRSMRGRGINMDIQTTKIEISTNLHKLFLSLGTEMYWSQSQSAHSNYKGGFIQLTRNF